MNRLFYLLAAFLILLIIILLNSIFFGINNYQQKSLLVEANNLQIIKNNDLKNQNDILEFEIENAQKSNEHVENFAREKLNLSYPDEEFISFENEVKAQDE
ncbi:cell division protein FtsL [Gammaproteobacteria bacterium]|jgi:cell division protein FtsB|nr:cell division protein FtsL [Gammaproteobacteria bacterium]MDA7697315.1 cell division protein FtsL [Gammaproteobacteria bacterium]MDA7735198.1 cell division protein FtsL [Gammaproteobacteria bacterium]MDA8683759.1 cell division protein FtsL [Gammaproteobacteria bacterium]MDA8861327.1 cell division protein FtsL [Gammaproteobacteria bacterium]